MKKQSKKPGAPDKNQNARKHGLYSDVLTNDEQKFLAALAGRDDLLEEIALMRLALFRVTRGGKAALQVIAIGLDALSRAVNVQHKVSGAATREFESALEKALDVLAEQLGIEV